MWRVPRERGKCGACRESVPRERAARASRGAIYVARAARASRWRVPHERRVYFKIWSEGVAPPFWGPNLSGEWAIYVAPATRHILCDPLYAFCNLRINCGTPRPFSHEGPNARRNFKSGGGYLTPKKKTRMLAKLAEKSAHEFKISQGKLHQ
jgi:hypothetical protein